MKRSILALALVALAATCKVMPSFAADAHASHDHAKQAAAPAADPHAGHDHAKQAAAPAVDPHAGHDHAKAAPSATTKPVTTQPAAAKPAGVDSLGLLERAVARDSSKFDNLYKLGVMYLDRDRVNESIRVLSKARSLKPKNHKVLVNLGAAYDAAGQAASAQIYYREALQVAPGDSVATCRLASSLYAQANYKDAMRLLRGMISKGTGAYCAYFTLGVAFADAGIYRDAIRMWRRVVEIAPNSPEANSAKESIEVLEKFVKS